jgi:pimeloyl-ACP methyl ester carboxylesterase
MKYYTFLSMFFMATLYWSCDNNVLPTNPSTPVDSVKLTGTGVLSLKNYQTFSRKNIKIYYHIPKQATNLSPILIAIHGAERDGNYTRNTFQTQANSLGFIVIAPEFSNEDFPGGDGFNLGNVFVDGDNPSPSSLNPEEEWLFSGIDPIFEFMKEAIGSEVEHFDLFGHSAGGQFVHRFIQFKPKSKVNRTISAASGWYTVPDNAIVFPYGFDKSPAADYDLSALFLKKLYIIVGDKDNNPDDAGLRHNDLADAQGDDRLERAQYFYSRCREIAATNSIAYNWSFQSIPNAGHDLSATSTIAVNILYR